jgi:hypothetical protein
MFGPINSARESRERLGTIRTFRIGRGLHPIDLSGLATRRYPLPPGLPTPEYLLGEEGNPPPDRGASDLWPDNFGDTGG